MPLTPLTTTWSTRRPRPIDRVYTSDRNFYDRYFFGAHTTRRATHMLWSRWASTRTSASSTPSPRSSSTARRSTSSAHRAILGSDRMNTTVGPIGVEIVEPLRTSRVYAEPNEHGLSFDMTFEGVDRSLSRSRTSCAAPATATRHGLHAHDAERPLVGHVHRRRPDLRGRSRHSGGACATTRGASGPSAAASHRQRHRPTPDLAASTGTGRPSSSTTSASCTRSARTATARAGTPPSELLYPYAAAARPEPLTVVSHDFKLKPGTRLLERGSLQRRSAADGKPVKITMTPKTTLYMSGGGYSYLGGWRHGQYHGPLVVETEIVGSHRSRVVPKIGVHTQTICDYTVEGLGDIGTGHGIFEFLFLGAYLPYGFKTFGDVAPAVAERKLPTAPCPFAGGAIAWQRNENDRPRRFPALYSVRPEQLAQLKNLARCASSVLARREAQSAMLITPSPFMSTAGTRVTAFRTARRGSPDRRVDGVVVVHRGYFASVGAPVTVRVDRQRVAQPVAHFDAVGQPVVRR